MKTNTEKRKTEREHKLMDEKIEIMKYAIQNLIHKT